MSDRIPPPLALSLLLADNHLVDGRTGQHSIIGILSHVQAMRFPVMLPRLCMYAELTNGRGKCGITFRIVDANEKRPPVATAEMELNFEDPLVISSIGIGMNGLVFPEPGEYRAQILGAGELLLERRLVLVAMKGREPKSDGNV